MYTIDVKHPEYIMISSDFSQQEPKLTAFVSRDPNMIKAFQEGKDIYAFIASLAFNKSYEECLEFHPVTGEYQPDGKARRSEAKTIVLGICYGRSVPSIGQQLYSHDDELSDDEKTKKAQFVYDSVMKAFPNLKRLMEQSQAFAHKFGYVETILGRRRHLPDMMLDDFEFKPMAGYVNPDIDPLDLATLDQEAGIPQAKQDQLKAEFSKFKYFGQIAKRTKELYEKESIKVVNNRAKKNDARRQCVNCVDAETEILTQSGWKRYDEIKVGEPIVSFDLNSGKLIFDKVLELFINDAPDQEVYHLHTSKFDAIATKQHRWVMQNFDTGAIKVKYTEDIIKSKRPRYHILRIAESDVQDCSNVDIEKLSDRIYAGKSIASTILLLSVNQAELVYAKMLEKHAFKGHIEFPSSQAADLFQILCVAAGRCNNKTVSIVRKSDGYISNRYLVTCSERKLDRTARMDYMKRDKIKTNLTWCVSTNSTTWIARRNGKYYITGNSIIQGSAADFTKTALIRVSHDPRWKEVGGMILTVVHDEIVAQVPVENFERGAAILKEDMESSGLFLPFPIKCDITASYRWYGLEAPCQYTKPSNGQIVSEDDIKWVQYHLVEMGYELPNFKLPNGDDPIGDAAHGVSGQLSEKYENAIQDYLNRYNVTMDQFIDDIQNRVEVGLEKGL